MRRSPEIEALIRRYVDARTAGDLSRLRAMYSESDDLVAVGTREDDWIEGGKTLLAMLQADWDSVKLEADEIRHLHAFENGDSAWAILEADRTTSGGQTFRYRLTVIYILEEGVWRGVHSHFSIPEGMTISRGDISETLSELLDSIGTEEAGMAARTATVVFTDIVGSTALSAEMGDAAWSRVVAEHFADLRTAAEATGGTVVKTLGDGGMFTFETGGAALNAALAMRNAHGNDLAVRIGVHTGDLMAAGDDVVGTTVAKAARVTAAADGGQILVSATTVGIANHAGFSYGPPISLELKGLPGSHIVHELM